MDLQQELFAPVNSIFDSHAHYDDSRFDDCRDELLTAVFNNGVGGIINNSVDLFESAEKCLAMSSTYKNCYTAVGIHPEFVETKGLTLDEGRLIELTKHEKVVAIGEIGLDLYWDKISKREDQGVTPYNLRNCAYMDDFNKPKIVYAELARTGNAFTIDTNKMLVGNTGYIITFDSEVSEERLYCLTGFLNSKAILFYLDNSCSKFDENGWRWLRQFVENIPIPQKTDHQLYSEVTKAIEEQCNNDCLQRINSIVYEILGLTLDEIAYLENKYANY